MSAEISFTKRAAAELSKCLNGLSVSRIGPSKKTFANGSANGGKPPINARPGPIKGKEYGKDNKNSLESSSKIASFRDKNSQSSSNTSSNELIVSKTSKTQSLSNSSSPAYSGDDNSRSNPGQSFLFQSSRNVFKEISRSNPINTIKSNVTASPSKRPPPRAPPKTWGARCTNYLISLKKATKSEDLWHDSDFLLFFFQYFSPKECTVLAQVCRRWRDILYSDVKFWKGLIPIIYYNELRRINSDPMAGPSSNYYGQEFSKQSSLESCSSRSDSSVDETFDCSSSSRVRGSLYNSIDVRGFDSICLYGASDSDVFDFASRVPPSTLKTIVFGSLKCSNVTDKGLDIFLASISLSLRKLELSGCNKISDSGLWTSLVPRLESLTLVDCINIADETVAAITQMLPDLKELNLQAYHVTDTSMACFGPSSAREKLRNLRLTNCWELSNQGVINIAHGLPFLEKLSLSGCSKISDDAIEVIAEQLRGLTSLDLSWLPRISDASLEYIACDLSDSLTELILDRCPHITDSGLGYIATMTHLTSLYLRWCPQITNFGVQTICSMKSLRSLSLAGCSNIKEDGVSCLVQLQQLTELELVNCKNVPKGDIKYLRDNLPISCNITPLIEDRTLDSRYYKIFDWED